MILVLNFFLSISFLSSISTFKHFYFTIFIIFMKTTVYSMCDFHVCDQQHYGENNAIV